MNFKLIVYKLKNWEYWPVEIVYFPFAFLWAWYALRLKHIFFFVRANPVLKNGGFFNISKISIYELLPVNSYPNTLLVSPNQNLESVLRANYQLDFPLIVKPDKGLRGMGVEIINKFDDLVKYHLKSTSQYLIQSFVDFKQEAGIFFYRDINTGLIKLTGIVQKEFFKVTGNGISTLEELILLNPRFELQLSRLKQNSNIKLNSIPAKCEVVLIEPIGNHNRGTLFRDKSSYINSELEAVIGNLIANIDGLNYGRIDIKFESWEQLYQGKSFKIIELNGGLSEPAHIYDPDTSYFKGMIEIYKHLKIVYALSLKNHSIKIKNREVMLEWSQHLAELRSLN